GQDPRRAEGRAGQTGRARRVLPAQSRAGVEGDASQPHVERHRGRRLLTMSVTTAADGLKDVATPLSDADVESLKTGDRVRISGVVYTARDAAHGRLWPLILEGKSLPIDVRGQIIYYTGPSPAKPGEVVGSIGPTTGSRMDKFTPALIKLGLKGTMGKGARSQAVKDAFKQHRGVYFGAICRPRGALSPV